MTLTIEIQDNKQAVLDAKAQAQGVSTERYAERILNRDRHAEGS